VCAGEHHKSTAKIVQHARNDGVILHYVNAATCIHARAAHQALRDEYATRA